MKTLSPSQYSQLPEDKKRYWKAEFSDNSDGRMYDYTPVLISLEEAERVIEELLNTPTYINMSNIDYGKGWHNALTEALTKLKTQAK